MSKASKHMERVKSMSCGVCGAHGPSDAHHILEGRIPSRKSPDWLVVPLCKGCHTGTNGIHGDRAMWKIYKSTELEVLADTLEQLYG